MTVEDDALQAARAILATMSAASWSEEYRAELGRLAELVRLFRKLPVAKQLATLDLLRRTVAH